MINSVSQTTSTCLCQPFTIQKEACRRTVLCLKLRTHPEQYFAKVKIQPKLWVIIITLYALRPEIILGEKFATNLHIKFYWKNEGLQFKCSITAKDIIHASFIWSTSEVRKWSTGVRLKTNKQIQSVRNIAWNCFFFQSRKPSMINNFTEEKILHIVTIVSFLYPINRLLNIADYCASQDFRTFRPITIFITQVKRENLVRNHAVDIPCFFHVWELARSCIHGSVVEENANPPWCTAKLTL